jgi:membrane protein DedA with SNARE-associated domain
MIETVIHLLEEYIIPLGSFGVFSAEVIEEIIVPIPSAMILLGSGFLFLKGSFSLALIYTLFFTIVIPATLGLTLGSLVIYGLAYKGGKPFLEKYGRWLSLSWTDVEVVNQKFKDGVFDEWSLILARIFPIIPSVLIAAFCGLTRMSLRKYITLTLIGAFFKALILALIGWQVGALYLKYANIIGHIENTVLALTIASIAGMIVYRKFKQKVVV